MGKASLNAEHFSTGKGELHTVWEEGPGRKLHAKVPIANWGEILGVSHTEGREAVRTAVGVR